MTLQAFTRSEGLPQERDRGSRSRARRALVDVGHGLSLWKLWVVFGWIDIRQRYRRALIGPFWITISMGTMVGTLGLVYSTLFRVDPTDFIPFLAAGFAAWTFISTTISEATLLFLQAEAIIKNASLPVSIHLYRLLWRNVIIFVHNAVIMIVVYLVFRIDPGLPLLFLIPGFALVVLILVPISLMVAMICLRFRDAPPIVASLLQIVFFITPILYHPAQLSGRLSVFTDANPFYHLVDAIRAPLLGQFISMETLEILGAMLVVGWGVAFALFCRYRSRIAYWL